MIENIKARSVGLILEFIGYLCESTIVKGRRRQTTEFSAGPYFVTEQEVVHL
jgi:hypothetical protein